MSQQENTQQSCEESENAVSVIKFFMAPDRSNKLHSKRNNCPNCYKSFPNQEALDIHYKITGHKSDTNQSNLSKDTESNNALITNDGTPIAPQISYPRESSPNCCNTCERGFINPEYLVLHYKLTAHKNTSGNFEPNNIFENNFPANEPVDMSKNIDENINILQYNTNSNEPLDLSFKETSPSYQMEEFIQLPSLTESGMLSNNFENPLEPELLELPLEQNVENVANYISEPSTSNMPYTLVFDTSLSRDNLRNKIYICNFCGIRYKRSHTIKEHLSICDFRPADFDISNIDSNSNQQTPMPLVVPSSTPPPELCEISFYACNYCGREFKREGFLTKHYLVCGNRPITPENLSTNTSQPQITYDPTLEETVTKRYGCPHCERTFKTKGNLKAHLQVHLDYRPYNCLMCGKSFIRRDIMFRHYRRHFE